MLLEDRMLGNIFAYLESVKCSSVGKKNTPLFNLCFIHPYGSYPITLRILVFETENWI